VTQLHIPQEINFRLRCWEQFIPSRILSETPRRITQCTPSTASPEQPTTFLQSCPTKPPHPKCSSLSLGN